MEISTSILTVEKENATKIFYDLEVAKTDYYHIDIMDGKFVEKNTEELMYEYANTIKQISNVPLDVHLMVENVKENIERYIPLEPNIITFHYEVCQDNKEIEELIKLIRDNNIKPAISIKPNTSIEVIKEFLPRLNMVLIMTVEPGKGGQTFMDMSEKIKDLHEIKEKYNYNFKIEVDGGINNETIKKVNADIAVVGSYITSSNDYKERIEKLK